MASRSPSTTEKSSPAAAPDTARGKALASALAQIEKQFGKGSVMRLNDRVNEKIDVVSTGSLGLDIALGVGGLPKGRVVEIYGPESSGKTTLTLQAIAQCQRQGGVAAFVDAEHALDPTYAEKLGVNVGDLLVSQPDTGEQALEIADMLVRSGAVDLVVIDSVAALVPKAEIEGEMGDSHVGLHARLMSQALRKLTGNIKRTNCLVIFINQIRMKIGVMFGCFHYNARVLLADGTTVKIGKLVNQRRSAEVMSWNPETGKIEPRKIVNWFNNGRAEKFLQIVVSGGKTGRQNLPVTPNHTIFTPEGEVSAGDLKVGDEVLSRVPDFDFTDDQKQLIIGSALGDASLRQVSGRSASVRFGHGLKQLAYLEWKKQMMGASAGEVSQRKDGLAYSCDVKANAFAFALRDHLYAADGGRQVTCDYLSRLDARAIAVWYMDDGNFSSSSEKWGNGKAIICNKALSKDDRQKVIARFEELGFGTIKVQRNGFAFDSDQTAKLHEMIAPYVHPSLDYKLSPRWRGRFTWDLVETRSEKEMRVDTVGVSKVLAIYDKPITRNPYKYDLEIEGNHNYLVDGVVVHNSPETTTGGNALKFYASVRLDIRRIGAVKKGEDVIGSATRVKVIKNKVAPPFRQCEFEILYGEGTSREGEIIEMGALHNIIDKSGAWYSYNGERIGQGKENVRQFLKDNPAIANEIDAKIREKLAVAPLTITASEVGESED